MARRYVYPRAGQGGAACDITVLWLLQQCLAGKRQEEGNDDTIPCIIETHENEKAFRKSWARLIQKIYEVYPLICPQCKGKMRIISFIEDRDLIRTILKHLGLWLVKSRPIPKSMPYPSNTSSPIPHFNRISMNDDHLYRDPEYSWDAYIQS